MLPFLLLWALHSLRKLEHNITHSHIFLFPKEAHADVVPERGVLGHSTCCHSVLVHGHIKVTMGLHHAACSQDGLGIKTMIRETLEEDALFDAPHDERQTVPPDSDWPYILTELLHKKPYALSSSSLATNLSLYQGIMFVQAPTYLIIVGVKSEGISKMLKCFLVFPKLMKNEYRKLYSIAYIWYDTYPVVLIVCVHTIQFHWKYKKTTSKK